MSKRPVFPHPFLYVEMQLTKAVHGYKKKQYILAQFSKQPEDAKDLVLVKLLVFKGTGIKRQNNVDFGCVFL